MDGPTLKAWRIEQDLSQPQLARSLGISRASIARYEAGAHDIPDAVLAKLKKVDADAARAKAYAARPIPTLAPTVDEGVAVLLLPAVAATLQREAERLGVDPGRLANNLLAHGLLTSAAQRDTRPGSRSEISAQVDAVCPLTVDDDAAIWA
jgi:transcriptional regulator with XRE-family HTH domain